MVDYKKFQQFYSKNLDEQKKNQDPQAIVPGQDNKAQDDRSGGNVTSSTGHQGYQSNRTNNTGTGTGYQGYQGNRTGYQGNRTNNNYNPNGQRNQSNDPKFQKSEGGNEVKSEYEMNKMGYIYDPTDLALGSRIMIKAGNLSFPRRKSKLSNMQKRFINKPNFVDPNEPKKEKIYQKQTFDIKISGELSTNELALLMNEKAADVLKFLIKNGLSVNVNQNLDLDTIELVVTEFGHNFEKVDSRLEELKLLSSDGNDNYETFPRPPIVSIMGHVDHGKTTLLDVIRKSNIASHEAGGITQKIGAYQVKCNNHDITFIDTPGHEAFSAIRSRGARLTDIVILVVAADDGIMPQTVEAIQHAKKAGVPIIVAINKIDKQPNIDNIRNALMGYDVIPDDLGGSSIIVPISAKNGTNIDKLLEAILLEAEVLQLSARKEGLAQGVIIDSRIDKKRGPIATVIVKEGILQVGDNIISGDAFGKIRILTDYHGKQIKEAIPGQPAEIAGFSEIPRCGDKFYILKDEKAINEARALIEKNKEIKHNTKTFKSIKEQGLKVLNLIVKADSQGSLEAINLLIKKISLPGGEIRVLTSELGLPNNMDINMSILSKATIISFNQELTNDTLLRTIKEKNISYENFEVIYRLVDYVKEKFEALYPPIEEEVEEGSAEVRGLFEISKVGPVLGCIVKNGAVRRGSMIRLKRKGVLIGKYKISSIRRLKDDVKEVTSGLECGISVDGKVEGQLGDTIEAYKVILKSPFPKN